MPSDAIPDHSSEPEQGVTATEYVQRAALLADLDRFEDAVVELDFALRLDPADPWARTMLARVHLVSRRPAEALAAANEAMAVAPGQISPLVVRGIALAELHRFAEAAQVAEEILRQGPEEAYAQRTGAALLSESRNGQSALDAAWHAVELAPVEPEGHLVLALVAARLRQFNLAERAYREAMRLNPDLAHAKDDTGLLRLEQRRYAEALAGLAEAAAQDAPVAFDPRLQEDPPAAIGRSAAEAVQRLVLVGAGVGLIVALLVAVAAPVDGPLSRFLAVLFTIAGLAGMLIFSVRLSGASRAAVPQVLRDDRPLAAAVLSLGALPCLVLLYAAIGGPWPLVLAIVAGALAEVIVFLRARA